MPNRRQNLIGKHFGHLTVIAKSKRTDKHHSFYWICKCDCGNTTEVTTGNLHSGGTTSCGHTRYRKIPPLQMQRMHAGLLNNRPYATNTSGYRNIRKTPRAGSKYKYQVIVRHKGKQHSVTCDNLRDALVKREELRAKYWPNYTPLTVDKVLKEKER